MESFDVTSLYTHLSNDSASQATHELLTKHQGAASMYCILNCVVVILLMTTFRATLAKARALSLLLCRLPFAQFLDAQQYLQDK
ncbi:hypothetical protein KIN20_010246, partial [Parelaphostrongylus tenuis]